jgi:tRNA nucleotidyltransferase (CCA-adding enzyme)
MDTPQTGAPHTAAELRVLKRITPPKTLPAIVGKTLTKVEEAIKARQELATVALGGSIAKGTYLKGDHDIDVFVRFSPDYDDATLADRLQAILESVFDSVERVHGSRDYFHVLLDDFVFEFIPVLHISSWQEARNVTDMSPLHVDYVAQHTGERPWLAGEIRLTKQFCKAAKVYGAESYIGGFSGHVVDLLNIHYGGFRQLLEAAAQWPARVVLDPERQLDNPLTELNDAKIQAPLVIVDPVQQDRNSAAALTQQAFARFKARAAEYLAASEDEQEAYFTIEPLDAAQFAAEYPGSRIIAVTLTPQRGKKDVVGAKCYKVYQHIWQQLVEHNFAVHASTWEFSPARTLLLFALEYGLLSKEEELAGPPVHRTTDVARFQTAHETTYAREGKVYALETRKFRDPVKLIEHFLSQEYVLERVKASRCKPIKGDDASE